MAESAEKSVEELTAGLRARKAEGNVQYANREYEAALETYGAALREHCGAAYEAVVGKRRAAERHRAQVRNKEREIERERERAARKRREAGGVAVESERIEVVDSEDEEREAAWAAELEALRGAAPAGLSEAEAAYVREASIVYGNRAACYLGLEMYGKAVEEATKSVELEPLYAKALWRRAIAEEKEGKYREALEDLRRLEEADGEIFRGRGVQESVRRLEPLAKAQTEREMREVVDKLKGFGNRILGKFGMSLDNFKMEKDPATGGYSLHYENAKTP